MPTFTELVQDLPLELFDEIKALTFAVDGEEVIEITKDYKPPVQLQVDRASRTAVAEKYYAAKTFLLPSPTDPLSTKWFESLDTSLFAPIKKLRFPVKRGEQYDWIVYKIKSGVPGLFQSLILHGHWVEFKLDESEFGFWKSELDTGGLTRKPHR